MGLFRFKRFNVDDSRCGMKIGTDAVLLGAWAEVDGFSSILDAGCGSGVIALMMAQRNADASITAIDINHDAWLDTIANIAASPWPDRIVAVEGDVTAEFPDFRSGRPLLIISNPPFFNETLRSPSADRALARHGDDFGVESLLKIAAANFKSAEDSLAFIAPTSRESEIEFLLSMSQLSPRRVTHVFSNPRKPSIRTLWQVGRESFGQDRVAPIEREDLFIRDADNIFTQQYLSLTSPFYLDR
ncbi:MAG: methyltransferase [Staphylococcus sp.]|nr:methyltransferase [Staphylococcus sp.]